MSTTIKAIAVDDEPLALEIISSHASQIQQIELVKTFTNPVEALNWLNENTIDLLFLDINMRDVNGIEFMESLSNPPAVIYTTAYSEYAVKSYELNAIDYLLKPVKLSRFIQAVQKLTPQEKKVNEELFFKDGNEFIKLNTAQIIYIESDGNYLEIHTPNNKSVIRKTLKEIKTILPPDHFIQVHRSFVINTKKVMKVEANRITLENNQTIPLGVTYRTDLYQFLKLK